MPNHVQPCPACDQNLPGSPPSYLLFGKVTLERDQFHVEGGMEGGREGGRGRHKLNKFDTIFGISSRNL